jgi:hypothetical protein
VVLTRLFNEAWKTTVLPFEVAEVMTGKFCSPASASPSSFAVTSFGPRSMPSPPFA